jgi:predicted acylesterase/phospholipase RssA
MTFRRIWHLARDAVRRDPGVLLRAALAAMAGAALSACAHVVNLPVNIPTADAAAGIPAHTQPTEASEDDLLIGLAFSGGGTRAAAFSIGALQGLADIKAPRGRGLPLIDHIDFVTGVSGGSITAAYFGLKKRAALDDFRERFLLKNAEEPLRTSISLANIARALGGGVNEDVPLRNWLDANLFEGATFSALLAERRPRIWINATDIYNRTPFVFGRTSFSVICSDLAAYPIAAAVAASAAVPLAFAPVVLEAFPQRCNATLPRWVTRAMDKRDSPILQAFARGISHYRDGSIRYIKLLDGGLADNYGLSGFTIARESSETPYGPLTPAQAVKLRRVLFLVVDAGRGLQAADWVRTLEGPSGSALVSAITDAALEPSVRASYTAFERTMLDWRNALIAWRCGAAAQAIRAARGGPNCRDLRFYIGRLGFDQLSPGRAAQLNAVPTRFVLPPESVDALIAAGRDALVTSSAFRAFLAGL